jgi:hypothetical protein
MSGLLHMDASRRYALVMLSPEEGLMAGFGTRVTGTSTFTRQLSLTSKKLLVEIYHHLGLS